MTFKVSETFASTYLKGAELVGRAPLSLTIESAEIEVFDGLDGGDKRPKPVLTFFHTPKKMVLNRTNSMLLAAAFGDDTGAWIGKTIEVYAEKIPFQGRIVDGLRVRIPVSPAAAQDYDEDVVA